MPPLSAAFILSVNLYWGLFTLVAWSLCCWLIGYLWGYLRGRPKYIILHEQDLANLASKGSERALERILG